MAPENCPEQMTEPLPTLELLPPLLLSQLEIALLRPLPDFAPLTNQELQLIGRETRDDISSHFLTSLLLRFSGDPTSIKNYLDYTQALGNYTLIQAKAASSKETTADYTQRLASATAAAKPYIEMKTIVNQYRDDYRTAYESIPDLADRREFTAEIYERSDKFTHPGLDYIKQQRQQLREEMRAGIIESDRIFRLMLLEAAPNQS